MSEFSIIVHDLEPVTLVGGGNLEKGDIALAQRYARRVVAADSGAMACLEAGVMPEAIIGDMDSAPDLHDKGIAEDRIYRIAEQDSTDFDKALRHIEAPLVIGVGFSGGRMDHELACYNALVRHSDRPCLLLGEEDLVFHCPSQITLPLEVGARVSLFPMTTVTGRSEGLRWPIDGIEFAPGGRIGTSNEASGAVRLAMDGAGMLVILSRDCLELAVAALLSET